MIIFDGQMFAQRRELAVQQRVAELAKAGKKVVVAAILFEEDKGSQLYTGLKQQAAERVGIIYQKFIFSIQSNLDVVHKQLALLNHDATVTGIIIQKPSQKTWEAAMSAASMPTSQAPDQFSRWWRSLVEKIDEQKDVDGLHPATLAAIERGTWQGEGKVLPATAKAVLSILEATQLLVQGNYAVLGKSDILGKPLAYELKNRGFRVELLGKKELQQKAETGEWLKEANVVISATGQALLLKGEMLSYGVVLIDVGEPRPDIDRESLKDIASFLTPVPGGVGPVTVVSLLENAVQLVERA